jgi:hypothetical protein
MSSRSRSLPLARLSAEPSDGGKGLRSGPLALAFAVALGLASAAPAYSIAATLGLVVAGFGLQSPAVMILAFIPMR